MAPKLKLHYFNISGMGQPIRDMLNHGKIPFEDYRIDSKDWLSIKSKYPFGVVPVLEIDNVMLPEYTAIVTYVADVASLKPSNLLDNARGMAMLSASIASFQYLKPLHGCSPEDKPKLLQEAFNSLAPILDKLEAYAAQLYSNGYLVGGKLSFADFCMYHYLLHATGMVPSLSQKLSQLKTLSKVFADMKRVLSP